MDQQDRTDRAVEALHVAMLGDSLLRDTSILVDEACGWKGAHLIIVDPQSVLDDTMVGVVFLDRRGRIVNANACAREILRRRDGVSDRDGVLRASMPKEHTRLGRLLADALPIDGRQAVGGSITLERSLLLPRLVVHINPVVVRTLERGARSVAALVLLIDPGARPKVDADLVAETFRLTRAESQVAAALAEGTSVREIAESTFRAETTVRWLIKQIHSKLRISRQADLVRMVLSVR